MTQIFESFRGISRGAKVQWEEKFQTPEGWENWSLSGYVIGFEDQGIDRPPLLVVDVIPGATTGGKQYVDADRVTIA